MNKSTMNESILINCPFPLLFFYAFSVGSSWFSTFFVLFIEMQWIKWTAAISRYYHSRLFAGLHNLFSVYCYRSESCALLPFCFELIDGCFIQKSSLNGRKLLYYETIWYSWLISNSLNKVDVVVAWPKKKKTDDAQFVKIVNIHHKLYAKNRFSLNFNNN